jgi:hypothetical protein
VTVVAPLITRHAASRAGRGAAALILLLFSSAPQSNATTAGASVVRLQKDAAGWHLLLNGSPYYVKGISCNDATGDHGEDFLKMAADAGANTVRIYGEVTPEYLDRAAANGLHVNVGFWLNAIRGKTSESYRDKKFCKALRRKALDYVRKYKDHPALLTWTLGNEVFIFTESDKEREAFGRFLKDLIQAVHQEDPNHPIIYASSYTRCLPYLKRWAPDIDIVGVNVTGGAGSAIRWCDKNDFDKPVIVTEFAPFGAWEQRKDVNDLPYDPFDQFKADNFQSSWRQIVSIPERCIGGFAFVLSGLRNQDSLTWYNMNYGGLKRAAYWTLSQIYTGKRPPHPVPKIVAMNASPVSEVKGGEDIEITVKAADTEPVKLTYEYFITNIAKDPLIVQKPVFYPPSTTALGDGHARVKAPKEPGAYRLYAEVEDPYGNVAIADRSLKVAR